MSTDALPLNRGSRGAAVGDLQRRLADTDEAVSLSFFEAEKDIYGDATTQAVRAFQVAHGLIADGDCGRQTWAALVEAAYRLGDRMLYLRSPMTRGDDVLDLQQRLGRLGFDAGWLDGIFGPDTERAVREFQHNVGVNADGVAGRSTVDALARLSGRVAGDRTVAAVREIERLRAATLDLSRRRIVIGEDGSLAAMANAVSRSLQIDGAEVVTLSNPDLSVQARSANTWGAELYVGIGLYDTNECSVSYFATEGFESAGGHSLALKVASSLNETLNHYGCTVMTAGLRLPILRETRMPAIWARLGPPAVVVENSAQIAESLALVVGSWARQPLD